MKKHPIFLRCTALMLLIFLLLPSFASCQKSGGEKEPTDPNLYDLTDFQIIRASSAEEDTVSRVVDLKSTIKNTVGIDIPVKTDVDTPEGAKEIVVGKTNRTSSTNALEKLATKTSKEAYIIDITDESVAIVGTTEAATRRAVRVFINNYVSASPSGSSLDISAGRTLADLYDPSKLIEVFDNGVEVELVQAATTIISSRESLTMDSLLGYISQVTSAHYPSIIELKYQKNEEDNGKLIAHFCLSEKSMGNSPDTAACFAESDNGGKTWKLLARPEEQKSEGLKPGQMAHLYELPAQLGEYPAGTLVYASGSINYSIRSEIWVWYSTDCGKTWTQTSLIAEGGCVDPVPGWGKRTGVWEPFTWYEDGYLYCFYSDDSDPDHDQKIVYKRSKDGVNWSDIVDVCKFDAQKDRPGMFVMTKMGNGEFFMVYEYFGTGGGKIYCKKTDDITCWNPSDPGEVLKAGGYSGGSGPSCLWVPAGGDNGTLIATATREENGDGTHRMFVSFDYGETWTTMTNPLPYEIGGDVSGDSITRIGYSPSFVLGADGRTVYYLCTTDVPETGKRRIQFTSFKIY